MLPGAIHADLVQGSEWSHGSHIAASSVAFSMVISSKYSMSLPTGVPMTVRVTFHPPYLVVASYRGSSCWEISSASVTDAQPRK
jgi:hypothetical protein